MFLGWREVRLEEALAATGAEATAGSSPDSAATAATAAFFNAADFALGLTTLGAAKTASSATEAASKIAKKILLMRKIITQTARESKL
jgi:hypothetical protein